jgi:hypothetical protein
VDDAAVFPPGNAPLPQAVIEHRGHRQAPYAGAVGPLLVRATEAGTVSALLEPGERLAVALVVRPGGDPGVLPTAVEQLQRQDRAVVVGVELPVLDPVSLAPVAALGIPVWLEIRREELETDLDAVAAAGAHAKLRTGGLDPDDVPGSDVLADFLRGVSARALRFKLTAGLHHAVRGVDVASGLDQHGVANVLLATAAATAEASGGPSASSPSASSVEPDAVRALLDATDPARLAAGLRALTSSDVARTRAAFASFGCCGVTDPLTELSDLMEVS